MLRATYIYIYILSMYGRSLWAKTSLSTQFWTPRRYMDCALLLMFGQEENFAHRASKEVST